MTKEMRVIEIPNTENVVKTSEGPRQKSEEAEHNQSAESN